MYRTLFLALALTLALAVNANAATTFTVDSIGDTDDAAINGVCNATGGGCTLRAAQTEVNNNLAPGGSPYTINIDPSIQGQTISSTGGIAFTQQVTVDGCAGVASPTQPCTGYDVTANANGFTFFGTGGVRGLAISGPGTQDGVFTVGTSTSLTLENNWIGQELTGAAGGWTNGVLLRGDNAYVGGLTASTRNVISNNTIGIRIEGDNTIVSGNYLGTNNIGTAVDQNGNAVAGNQTNISVTRANVGDPAPAGTVIGGTLDAGAASTSTCDGACNVIARGVTRGIDLDGPSGFTAGQTTIKGNYIGLDASGTIALHNGTANVDVAGASTITVGGPSTNDRNVIAGGATYQILNTGPGGLTVQNNFIGMNAAGTVGMPAVNNGILTNGNAINPTIVRDNRITHAAGTGRALEANGIAAQIKGNIFGVGTGGQNLPMGGAMRITGSDNVIGGTSPGDANVVGNSTLVAAVDIDGGDGNQVLGNLIGVDGNGISRPNFGGVRVRFFMGGADAANNNVIGGDTAAEENTISASANDAILISGATGAGNRVFGNNGLNNSGLFVDVGAGDQTGDGEGNPSNHNGGVQMPTISTATTLAVSGTADPSATVRVFEVPSGATPPNSSLGMIGKATADGGGNWTLTYSTPLPNDTYVAANQTTTANNSGELTNIALSTDATPPDTSIDSGPNGLTANASPQFTFSSNEAGGTFECAVDSGSFSSCTSGITVGPLGEGQHTFHVRARDAAANLDASPATRTFTVDTTPPDTSITSGPDGLTNNAAPQFGLSSEAGATFECRLDGGAFASCTTPYAPGQLGDGQHTVEVRAKDGVGNLDASPASRTFTVDAAPPDTSITSGPEGLTSNSAPQFGLASEAGAAFQCRVDGGSFATCTTPFSPGQLADGPHTVEVRALDAAGNADGSPASRSFTVDTQAPVTTVTGGPSGLTRDSTPTFSLGGTGASSFKCSVDGGAYNACPASFTTASLADGAHTLGVKASDQVGNEDATPATRSFRVDTTAPRVGIRPAKPRASASGVIKLRISCPVTEFAECRGTLMLLKKKSKKRKRYSAARGKTVTVKLKLTDAALAQLQAAGVLPVTASAASRDLLGNRRIVKRKLRVRA